MTPSTGNLSLLFQNIHGKLIGITGAYGDVSIGAGDETFHRNTRLTERTFESKAREYDDFMFAGIQIETRQNGYLMHQECYAMYINPLSLDCTFKEFRLQRHELSWLKTYAARYMRRREPVSTSCRGEVPTHACETDKKSHHAGTDGPQKRLERTEA